MEEKKSFIPCRLKNAAVGGHVAGTEDIYDDNTQSTQQEINAQHEAALNAPSTGVIARLKTLEGEVAFSGNFYAENDPSGIVSGGEKITTTNAVNGALDYAGYFECSSNADAVTKAVLNTGYALRNGGCIKIKMTNANTADNVKLQLGNADAKDLYYDGSRVGSGNSWEAGEVIEVYYNGTAFYANNVAGGSGDGAFDISKYKAVNGTPATYRTLAEALGTNGVNVPSNKRKGGMTVKYIQLTDATYSLIKTGGLDTQPIGVELQSAISIADGVYTGSQLPQNITLPQNIDASTTYYLAVTQTVDEQEVTTYTMWVVTKLTNDITEYVQWMLKNTTWSIVQSDWVGKDETPTAGSTNWVTSGGVFEEFYKDRTEGKTLRKTAMCNRNKLKLTGSTIGTHNNNHYNAHFYPCVKGDFFRFDYQATSGGVSASRKVRVVWTATKPADGVSATIIYNSGTIDNTDLHQVRIVAPNDGFICVFWIQKAQDTNQGWTIDCFDSIFLYKWYDLEVTNSYVSLGILPTTWTKSKYLNADIDSEYFGQEVAFASTHTDYGVSSYIDVEDVSYIRLKNFWSVITDFFNIVVGSVFYDSEKQPLSVACFMEYAIIKNYGTIIVKVPTGAKYLRVTGNLTNTTYTELSKMIEAWSVEKVTDKLTSDVGELSDLPARVGTLEEKSVYNKKLNFTTVAWGKDNYGKSRKGMLGTYSSNPVIIGNQDSASFPRSKDAVTYMDLLTDLGVEVGDVIKVTAKDDYDARICFVISWNYMINVTSLLTVPTGESVHTIPAGTTQLFTIPEDTVFIAVLAKRAFTKTTGAIVDVMPNVSIQIGFSDYVDSTETEDNTSILNLNPRNRMEPRFMSARKKVRHDGVFSSEAIIFCHISDCHGANTNDGTSVSSKTWRRFVEFSEYWKSKGYISDMIDTGDIVEDFMINKHTNPDNTNQTSIGWRIEADAVLTVIGNHDTASGIKVDGDNDYNWLDNIGVLSYNKYILPNVDEWGVVQPENAEENGYCFYYKDYQTSTGNNSSSNKNAASKLTLRVIFVDVMGWGYTHDGNGDLVSDNTQSEWVSSVLADAANNGYHVAVAVHYMPMQKKRIECSYTSLSAGESISAAPTYNRKSSELALLVAKFQRGTLTGINDGVTGKFFGYISGHSHYDAIRKAGGIWDFTSNHAVSTMVDGHECIDFDDERYPQIEFSVGAGYVNLGELADYFRQEGTLNQDNFQVIAFQMYNRYVKCFKIGCNVDQYMRKKDMVDIYTGSINEFNPSKTDYTTGLVTKDGIIYRLLKPVVVNNLTSWELSDKVRASRVMSEYVTR